MHNKDTKPAVSLIDLFIDALKRKYMVKLYTPKENYMEIIVTPYESREPIVLGIEDIKKFNRVLFFYINSVNDYYIRTRKIPMNKSMCEIFRETLLGISLEEMLDFTSYLEKLTDNLTVTKRKDAMLKK